MDDHVRQRCREVQLVVLGMLTIVPLKTLSNDVNHIGHMLLGPEFDGWVSASPKTGG